MDNDSAIAALGALAQGTRLDVFRLLVQHEPVGVAAGEIARRLDVPQNTMSAHLGILARARLVRSERQSRSIIYRANFDHYADLMRFLLVDCTEGHPETAGLRDALLRWLGDPGDRIAAGRAARDVVHAGLGAAQRSYALVAELLDGPPGASGKR